MRFNPSNFLYAIKQLVTGINGNAGGSEGTSGPSAADGGIKVDRPANSIMSVIPASAFPAITDNTTGTASTTFAAIAGTTYATDAPAIKNALAEIAKVLNAQNAVFGSSVSSVPVISAASTVTALGTVEFVVPRDYDEASDQFAVRINAAVANAADNAVTVTGTATILPIATGTAVTKSAVNGQVPFTNTTAILTTKAQAIDIALSGFGLKRDDVVSVVLATGGTPTANGATYLYSVEFTYASCIVSFHDTDNDSPAPNTGNALR